MTSYYVLYWLLGNTHLIHPSAIRFSVGLVMVILPMAQVSDHVKRQYKGTILNLIMRRFKFSLNNFLALWCDYNHMMLIRGKAVKHTIVLGLRHCCSASVHLCTGGTTGVPIWEKCADWNSNATVWFPNAVLCHCYWLRGLQYNLCADIKYNY